MPPAARCATTSPPHGKAPRTSVSPTIATSRASTDPSVPPSTKTRATTIDEEQRERDPADDGRDG